MGHHRQFVGLQGAHFCDICHVFHQVDAAFQLAHGAFHLRVALVANHDEFVALFMQFGHLHVHLGDQRAGGIEDLKTPRFGFVLDRLAHPMGAEHQRGAGGHVVQVFDKDGAFVLEVIHHKSVMNDFMAHVNRPAKFGERPLHDFNRPVDPCAKTTRLRQNNVHFCHKTPITNTSKVTVWPASGWLKSNKIAERPSSRPCRTTVPA